LHVSRNANLDDRLPSTIDATFDLDNLAGVGDGITTDLDIV
jgi:hypothetical protein